MAINSQLQIDPISRGLRHFMFPLNSTTLITNRPDFKGIETYGSYKLPLTDIVLQIDPISRGLRRNSIPSNRADAKLQIDPISRGLRR